MFQDVMDTRSVEGLAPLTPLPVAEDPAAVEGSDLSKQEGAPWLKGSSLLVRIVSPLAPNSQPQLTVASELPLPVG